MNEETLEELVREVRTLREEQTLVYSEIVRLKERLSKVERDTPSPRQLGRVFEALRMLQKMEGK
jgi:hypothetical protein